MEIVFLCETLTTGGAETFVLRLAGAMQARGHQVRVAVLRGDKIERDLVASIAPLVPIDAYRPLGLRNILRLDGLLQRLGVDFSWLRWLQQRWVARLLSPRAAAGIVHSHLITSDLVAAHACARVGIPWLTTIHGDYLSFERTGGSKAARVPDFARAANRVARGVGAIVCITDEQLEKMRRLMPDVVRRNGFRKIYNGYPRPQLLAGKSLPEILRQIPEQALVVGMVARGIRDKGWDVLLEGIRRAGLSDAWVVLVGDGQRISELRQQVKDNKILFVGNVTNPLDYIQRFDIACLPSRFSSESLPTVIIEYLQQGKPVVASRVGEIPAMLRIGSGDPAGLVIDLDSESTMADAMAAALRTLADDPVLRGRMSRATRQAFEPFDMDDCARHYEQVYAEVARGG